MHFSTIIVALAAGVGALPQSTSSRADQLFEEMALAHHNIHRANHSAPDMTWSPLLAGIAHKISTSCVYDLEPDFCKAAPGGYCGSNREYQGGAAVAQADMANFIGEIITDSWYNNGIRWLPSDLGTATTNPNMTNFIHWGSLSQIVWKSSTQLGCASTYCPDDSVGGVGGMFTICLYEAAGNSGDYVDNVLPSRGWPSIWFNNGQWYGHKY